MFPENQQFEFGDFLLDPKEKVLCRNGKPVSITPKAFELLLVLISSPGRLLEKAELITAVWAGSFVEDANLPFTIGLLRKALGDDAQDPSFIKTVPRRGYRFIADVREVPASDRTRGENEYAHSPNDTPAPYALIAVSAVLILSLLAGAFLWFRDKKAGLIQLADRLTKSGKITIASISPDGRTLVFAQRDGVGESLWRRDIASGNETEILPVDAVEFVGLTVSPAGDYAYYSVFANNSVSSAFSRVPLNGGVSEKFPDIASDVSVSFSPDGNEFAYTESLSALGQTQLRIANADGSNPKTLLTAAAPERVLPAFRASPIAWSPDGSEIACAVQETVENETQFRILAVNAENGGERYLSENRWSFIENIVWKDDDNLALIDVEPNSPNRQIWTISRSTGETRQLSHGPMACSWLSAANEKLLAVERSIYSSLLVADFAEGSLTPQTKQIFNEHGPIEQLEWPADDTIFYNSWATGTNEIWRIGPEGTASERLTDNSNLTFGFAISPLDGSIVFSASKGRASHLFIAEPNGKNIRQLTSGSDDSWPRFMPDGKQVIYQQGSMVKPTMWRVSIDKSDAPKQIAGYMTQQPSVSPDGKTIAFQFMDFAGSDRVWRLGLVESSTGRLLNKIDFPSLITERRVVWRPDGSDLLTMVMTVGENSSFLLLSPTGGGSKTIDNVTTDKITSFAWSPDGKRLAFAANQIISDVVVLSE